MGQFTTFVGRPARKFATLATVASSSRRRASRVAQAMWGVIRQFRAVSSGLSGRIGSLRNHVHGRPGQPSLVQRLGQVLLDDQPAPGRC